MGAVVLNDENRTKSSVKVMGSNLVYRLLSLASTFITRTVFIYVLGEEYFGLNSLFTTILNVLSLTELGFGSAVTFYLYKPIADNDVNKIKALLSFFKRVYFVIGVSILISGALLVPFLDLFVNMNMALSVNLYVVYGLSVLNTAVTYMLFSYVQVLIAALQKGYVTNYINIIFLLISTAGCSLAILITKNYIVYLMARLVISQVNNLAIRQKVYRICPFLREKEKEIFSSTEKKKIFKNVGSIFLFKASSTIANTVDNIAISMLFGTVLVGYNANYEMLTSAIAGIISMIIYSFASSVGNLAANETRQKKIAVFREIDLINFFVSTVAFAGIYCLGNDFIRLWLHNDKFVLEKEILFYKAFNMFNVTVLNSCFVFREAMGLFQYGKYRNFLCGLCNLVLTFVMANWIGIKGVFLSTIISTLVLAEFVFPKIVFKYGFNEQNAWKEQIRLGIKMVYAIAVVLIIDAMIRRIPVSDSIISFILKMIVVILISFALSIIPYMRSRELKSLCGRVEQILIKKGA